MTRYHVQFGEPRGNAAFVLAVVVFWVVFAVLALLTGAGLRLLWEWLA